jgi:putative oxidoreductase
VKTSFIYRQWVYLIARGILGGVFVYAGILKMQSPIEFADNIAAYQLLPANTIDALALGLPFFEIICGLLVLGGVRIKIGTLGISAMLLVFMGAILTALKKGLSIDCGCFGGHSWIESNLWAALGRNVILLLLAMYIYWQSLLRDELNEVTNV